MLLCVMDSWNKATDTVHPLEQIGILTVRLLRIAVRDQLERGEAQLKAQGIKVPLAQAYHNAVADKPPKKYSNLKIIERGTF